jgi:hypothetical protein
MRRMRKVNINVMAMGMRNRLSKRRGGIDGNLTGCLQGYVVLQYERTIKYLILNTNNIVLQIIPGEHNFDFHRTDREKYADQVRRGSVIPPVDILSHK